MALSDFGNGTKWLKSAKMNIWDWLRSFDFLLEWTHYPRIDDRATVCTIHRVGYIWLTESIWMISSSFEWDRNRHFYATIRQFHYATVSLTYDVKRLHLLPAFFITCIEKRSIRFSKLVQNSNPSWISTWILIRHLIWAYIW